MDLYNIIITSLGLVGVNALLVFILFYIFRTWFLERTKNSIKNEYDVKLHELDNALRKKTESELQVLAKDLHIKTETELAKIQTINTISVETLKTKLGYYSENQFTTYNELWSHLCDLKYHMLELWSNNTEDELKEFSSQLNATIIKLEKSALIIEEHHYLELIDILNQFASYEFKKWSLLQIKDERIKKEDISPADIKNMVKENASIKKRLLDYLPQIRSNMRNQISGISNFTFL